MPNQSLNALPLRLGLTLAHLWGLSQRFLHYSHEASQFLTELTVGNQDSVSVSESVDGRREICGHWHRGALHQHRNDENRPVQRYKNLQPDEIIGPEYSFAQPLPHPRPARSNNRQKDRASAKAIADCLYEVFAGSNTIHIHEDLIFAELGSQLVEDSAGVRWRVLTAIADKDVVQASYFPAAVIPKPYS